jgi:hypothetical protein
MPRFRTSGLIRLALIAAAAAALAGCGTASTTSSSLDRAASGATSPASTVTTTKTNTSPPSGTTTATATPVGGLGECRAAQLVLSYLGGQGATGHGDLGFAMRNTGAHACHTYGYPGIQFLDRTGRRLPTIPTHSPEDFFGHSPLRGLFVAPGASVSFRLDVSHGSGAKGRCPTAAALQVIPPGDTHALTTSLTNGAYECGHAVVSPLQARVSAHP